MDTQTDMYGGKMRERPIPFLAAFRRKQASRHLDFGLLAPRL